MKKFNVYDLIPTLTALFFIIAGGIGGYEIAHHTQHNSCPPALHFEVLK